MHDLDAYTSPRVGGHTRILHPAKPDVLSPYTGRAQYVNNLPKLSLPSKIECDEAMGKRPKKTKTKGRLLQTLNGSILYLDSGFTHLEWAAISSAMQRYDLKEEISHMTDDSQVQSAESDFPEAWKPNVGDSITGTLAGVDMIDPGGNGPYPCVTLETPSGMRNVHAFHSVLRRELARRAPKPGDEITITYQGQREGGRNGTYHTYRVAGGPGQAFDWATELPQEEHQQTQAQSAAPPIAPAPIPAAPAAPAGSQFGEAPPF